MGGDGDAVDRDVCSVEFPGPEMDAVRGSRQDLAKK